MAAKISFLAGQSFVIQDLAGSGLGFFGDNGFGASVKVGFYQGHTFITSGDGTAHGPEVSNVKYLSAPSGIIGQQSSGVPLTAIPNYQATLNIRFTYDTAVQAQNVQLRIYDRTNPDNAPTGVITQFAEVVHPDTVQNNNGSGNTAWIQPAGSSVIATLSPSPGVSGLYAGNGSNSVRPDTQHDWYAAISQTPTSIGSKTLNGLYISLEFL